jgi:hypothetical protein
MFLAREQCPQGRELSFQMCHAPLDRVYSCIALLLDP